METTATVEEQEMNAPEKSTVLIIEKELMTKTLKELLIDLRGRIETLEKEIAPLQKQLDKLEDPRDTLDGQKFALEMKIYRFKRMKKNNQEPKIKKRGPTKTVDETLSELDIEMKELEMEMAPLDAEMDKLLEQLSPLKKEAREVIRKTNIILGLCSVPWIY